MDIATTGKDLAQRREREREMQKTQGRKVFEAAVAGDRTVALEKEKYGESAQGHN